MGAHVEGDAVVPDFGRDEGTRRFGRRQQPQAFGMLRGADGLRLGQPFAHEGAHDGVLRQKTDGASRKLRLEGLVGCWLQ